MGLGQIQELDHEYVLAEKTFLQILEMVGKIPLTVAVCLAHLGLDRIYYQWNELEKAAEHIEVSIENAHLLVNTDIIVTCNVVKAYILMANSQLDEANAILSKAEVLVENNDFILRIPEIVDVHVILKLRQNQIEDAYVLANKKVVDISMARVWIAKGEIDDAIELLEKLQLEYVTKHINNELIKVQVLLSLCYKETGDIQKSTQLMCQLMTKLASEKFVRLYLDIGTSMIELIYQVRKLGVVNDYIEEILGSFRKNNQAKLKKTRMLVEPLSIRELEILELINQGLTNKEIGDQLFIALDTVKGHNRRIFGKLEVKTRIEAIKKANLLGIIDS
jgi:LuxR family maltose regulon positive regulatory protein